MEQSASQPKPEVAGPPAGNNAKQPGRKNGVKKIVLLVVLPVLILSGLGYYLWARTRVSTDDAYVEGRIHTIAPRVAGYVVEVLVDDNQKVKQGQVLLTLDPTDYEVGLASARAALAEARATLTSLELGVPLELTQTSQRVRGAKAELAAKEKSLAAAVQEVKAADEEIKRAQALEQLAALELKRVQSLRTRNALAQASLDQARTSQETAMAAVRGARKRMKAAASQRDAIRADLERVRASIELASTGQDLAIIKTRQVEAQKARVELAEAKVHQAELQLSYTKVRAPAAGRVTRRSVESGKMVSQGQPLMAVVPLDLRDIWVIANYKETQLADVRPGLRVTLEVDAYPGLELTGKVESIMAGTGAAFSLFPPENATGNYVKVVQRVPVKIVLDPPQGDDPPLLRVGMSVIPTIHLDD